MEREKYKDITDIYKHDVITIFFDKDLKIIKNNYNIWMGSDKLNIFSFIDIDLFYYIIDSIKKYNKILLEIDKKDTLFNFKYFIEGVKFESN